MLRVRDRGDGVVRGVISPGPDEPDLPYLFGFNEISLVNGGEAQQVRDQAVGGGGEVRG